MKRPRRALAPVTLFALCAASLAPRSACAQLLAVHRPEPGVSFGVAFEPEWVIAASYLAPIATTDRAALELGAGLELPPILPPRADLRAQALLHGRYAFGSAVSLACTLHAYTALARNDAGHFVGLGSELRCLPTLAGGGVGWALDLGWQSTFATHVEHSALAKRTFELRYPAGSRGVGGPRDGWYGWTSQRVRLGLSAAHAFSRHWQGAVALGTLFALQEQAVYLGFNFAQLPLYLELASRVSW